MDRKNRRTMDVYKKVGAEMYLLRQIYSKLLNDSSAVLRVPDLKRLLRAMDIINVVRSHVEDNMFADHTELPHEYIHVFYGRTDGMSGLDAVEKEIIDLAKGVADSLFCSAQGEPEDGVA